MKTVFCPDNEFWLCVKRRTGGAVAVREVRAPTAKPFLLSGGKAQIMSNNQLSVFNFEESTPIRTVTIGKITWFVGKDVCLALGYADPTNAMKQHCKGVVKRHPLETAGGRQEVRILSEADVMRLICGSKLPAAQKFERWVFEEVLPAIRKTGRYAAPSAPAKPLISAAPYFVPEATYYGVPVMSTTALAKRLNVTPAQIHSILQNNRAGLINGIEIYRIKTAGELRAGGCGEIWGRAVSRIDLFTESGARKIRNHWCPNLPAPSPFSAPAPVSPAVRLLDLPRRNPVRSAEYVTVTADEFRNRLDNRRLVIESTLRKLMAAGYDAREEMAELSYLRETVERSRRSSEQLAADIKIMLNQIGYMLDIGIDTRYRFDDDGRIIGRENSFTRP